MRPIHLALLALPLVAACAVTPRQQCEAPYRNQLHTVRLEIADTELVLQRGFRLVPARSEFGLHYCVSRSGLIVRPCTADSGDPMYDKRPINRAAETAKLTTLRQEQSRLEAGLAACATRYPE